MLGFLRNLSQLTNVPTELHDELEAEGLIFLAHRVGVVRHFSGHVPGVFSASGVSRYKGAFAFSAARVVATFPTRGDTNLRSIDCAWDVGRGPAAATITKKGLLIDIDLRGVDHAFSGSMKLHYKRQIPDEVLDRLPTTSLRFPVDPVFVYRAAGVRPK
ncbi:hypothetical protein [Mycobacterium sp. Aquia_213]|uniref:hypothetical protein n=1 Tax=Mycobacterium sp. Aquia_213 TaxID=2991728 RepID=UPI0022704B4D|nr:hypothetical protein [Mycobacterium sp. Aquia_213]WAC93471.1 hypothetical protein LMQ14_10240 [Mycobacterium sp. Aquia_213]